MFKRILSRLLWPILKWRYKRRNCENCPISHSGYESHDFDNCEIYGDDFRYEYCLYIWLPRWIIQVIAERIAARELARWDSWMLQHEEDSAL